MSRIFSGVLAILMAVASGPVDAEPERYRLDTDRSQVGFGFAIEETRIEGVMPVKQADLLIDLDNLPASKVDVILDAKGVRSGIFLVTESIKGPQGLDTANHPEIRFRSTRFVGDLSGATVTGDLTIRGITRPVTLNAGLYRQRGTEVGDRSKLSVFLTGTVSRAAFGADGFPGLVEDAVRLRILARIEK